jgi:micrococcal nuclease
MKLLLALALIALPMPALADTFHCVRYLGNYDGDTLTVEIPGVPEILGHRISVRIHGIDTPEIKGQGKCEKAQAIRARDQVRAILSKAKCIDLVRASRDKYFRILADVRADGRSIAEELVRAGLAERYDGGTKQKRSWCQK